MELVGSLQRLIVPGRCAACGVRAETLCRRCRVALAHGRYAAGPRLVRPSPCPAHMPPCWAAAGLDGVLRVLLTAYKDADRRDLAGVLAPLLAAAIRAAMEAPRLPEAQPDGPRPSVHLVPVPASGRSRRRRGDRPLESLVVGAAELLPGPVRVIRVLRPVRATRDQAGLDAEARRVNLAGAMALAPGAVDLLSGHRVVLVDDIVTTGATLVEGARALGAAGVSVRAAVIAATPRRAFATRPAAVVTGESTVVAPPKPD